MKGQKVELNEILIRARSILQVMKLYHRHEVHGLNVFPKKGPVILAIHHSLATYDGFLLGMQLFDDTGRLAMGLGDDLLFKMKVTKNWIPKMGILPASRENAKKILDDGHVLALAPGGMRESLRPSDERYNVKWNKRKGFIRLAIETGTPIVLAACPAADRIFRVYPNILTALVYKHFKFPLPIFRGFGLSLIPRPVKLVHFISAPMMPPEYQEEIFDQQVDEFHKKILTGMDHLLQNR